MSPSKTFATNSEWSLSIRNTEHFSASVSILASCIISFSSTVRSSANVVHEIYELVTLLTSVGGEPKDSSKLSHWEKGLQNRHNRRLSHIFQVLDTV